MARRQIPVATIRIIGTTRVGSAAHCHPEEYHIVILTVLHCHSEQYHIVILTVLHCHSEQYHIHPEQCYIVILNEVKNL